jgi:hypothetical protein
MSTGHGKPPSTSTGLLSSSRQSSSSRSQHLQSGNHRESNNKGRDFMELAPIPANLNQMRHLHHCVKEVDPNTVVIEFLGSCNSILFTRHFFFLKVNEILNINLP